MSELKTEEEQIEAFKTWWKRYGTVLVVVLVIAIGGYFGWQAWQRSQATHLSEASALYQNMLEASSDLSKKDNQKTVAYTAKQLTNKYDDTGYALFGEMMLAKLDVQNKEYDKAIASLEKVAKQTDDKSFQAIANLRLARVFTQKADYDKALATLDKVTPSEFLSQRQELAGDIYLLQGKQDKARAAYQKASDVLGKGESHPLLTMKIKDLVKG